MISYESDLLVTSSQLAQTIDILGTDGVICYPTEGVFGLGCDPHQDKAVQKLLNIKQRDWRKGLILISGSVSHFDSLLCHLSVEQKQQVLATWPGHYTWVLPDPDQVYSKWIKGEHNSVAVRVSEHPLIKQVTDELGGPIVSTSANLSTEPSIIDLDSARLFTDQTQTDMLLEAQTLGYDSPSTIRTLDGSTLR